MGLEMNKKESKNKESSKLNGVKPASTPTDGAKLTDNTSENSEAVSKESTKKTEEPKKESHGVLVTYIGSNIWQDQTGAKWKNQQVPGTTILSDRKYTAEEYEAREDIKFMVGYGEMKVTEI